MKGYARRIGLAAAVITAFTVFYILLGHLYAYAAGQNKINEYNRLRFEEFYAAPAGSIDWVFLGSSHAYCTFDPAYFDQLGVNAFQMGMPLQTMDSTYFTLREVLEYQHPDTVVLDLYWHVLEQDFDANQMEMLFEVWENDVLKKEYLSEALPWREKIKYRLKPVRYQTDFFAYVNNKLLNVLDYRFGLKKTAAHSPGEEYYKGRGYVYYDYLMTETLREDVAAQLESDMRGWDFADNQLKYLDMITALCAEENIRLILVTAPVSPLQFNRIKNYEAFNERITRYAQDNNLIFLDMNIAVKSGELALDDDYFFDANHLNARGVKAADYFFIDWLAKEY